MIRFLFTTLLLGVAATAVADPPPAARLVPEQSQITFVSKQMGVPVEGSFRKFDARIAFDPRKPEGGSVAMEIDCASATLGMPQTDVELAKPAWFDVARHPKAGFQSSAIKPRGEGRFEVAGKLTIKDTTKDVVVPVEITQSGSQSVATGSFTIQRLAYRIGEGEWTDTSMVADDVQVRFRLVLTGLKPL